jgi:hypothetical protein
MALDAAAGAGVKIDKAVWEEIRAHYLGSQRADGGWCYTPAMSAGTTLSMTSAGVCGLFLADRHLDKKPAGYEAALAKGLNYLGDRFSLEGPVHRYYILHSLGRVGQLSGKRVFAGQQAKHDWYRAGAEFLLREQAADGSWKDPRGAGADPVMATSLALLFMAKGE